MEEDIKILENSIKAKIFFNDRYYNALENLIKGYREIEENNKALEQGINPSYEETISELEKQLFDSIPKSKIQEKLDELDKEIRKIESKKLWNEPIDTMIRNRLCNYYNALKELLGDK